MIKYISTRGDKNGKTASEAILKGIADDGGLYVPEKFPKLDKTLEQLINLNYQDLAYEVLKIFYDDFTEEELRYCVNNAYDDKFDNKKIAPLVTSENVNFLELFHGKTIAFKDMALSLLPYLMKTSAKKNNIEKEIVILTATSGDTGKAALEGFADVEGTKIIVFYPKDGVSTVQKQQMVTQTGKNVNVIGVDGNFDDTQTGVKEIFTNKKVNKEIEDKGYIFSSANSINIGRFIPQVVYYFYAYGQMVSSGQIKLGEKINFTVPTGNFGNILAGFYATKLGLPVNKLICASNDNKILYDFFTTGEYDKNREFKLTISPSMDILISSNLERLIYHSCNDCDTTKKLMNELNETGKYTYNTNFSEFVGQYVTEDETLNAIKEISQKGYIMDTHTAVGYGAYKKYVTETNDNTKNVIVSTASPFKFAEDVMRAIDTKHTNVDSYKLIAELGVLNKTGIPKQIDNLDKKPVLHKKECKKTDMLKEILEIL